MALTPSATRLIVTLGIPVVTHLKDETLINHRLLVYLTSPEGQEPVEAAAFMPAPQTLIESDRDAALQ